MAHQTKGKGFKPQPHQVREQLSRLSREPFLEIVERLLVNSPGAADIAALAAKSPDRWSQALTMLAKLAGYSERTEQTVALADLSDSDLMLRLAELEAQNRPGSTNGPEQGVEVGEE